ncbi:hypothetical protein GCM10025877_08340 [Agromyces mangrovi Wang et al. 2018]|nr:hypothetical protein GCM10025877_08340 [Agromyces mangrovi]
MPGADAAAEWARSVRAAGPAELADLDRRLLASAPDVLGAVEREARDYGDEVAAADRAQGGAAAVVRIAARAESDHPRAGCASLLLTGALLLPVTVAFALLVARGTIGLADALAVGGVLASVSGVAALVLLVAAPAAPRLLQPLPRIAIGTGAVGVVTAGLALQRVADDPLNAASADGWLPVIVVSAVPMLALAVVDSVRRVRMRAALDADTADDRAIADPFLADVADARLRAVERVDEALAALSDDERSAMEAARAAALERLSRRGLLAPRRVRAISSEPVGALLLAEAEAAHVPPQAPHSA